jgi:GH15 family glucan-1,4-alpha-glucosidase
MAVPVAMTRLSFGHEPTRTCSGSTAVTAINSAERSAVQPFGNTLERYLAGWRGYDSTLRQPPNSLPGLSAAADAAMRGQYWLSANVLKADEDKTYLGAFVASPTDPWGQSVPATTTHPGWTYREVFTRDSYETFFSPADIAAEIAGLVAAAHLAQAAGDPARARLYLATADGHRRRPRDRLGAADRDRQLGRPIC